MQDSTKTKPEPIKADDFVKMIVDMVKNKLAIQRKYYGEPAYMVYNCYANYAFLTDNRTRHEWRVCTIFCLEKPIFAMPNGINDISRSRVDVLVDILEVENTLEGLENLTLRINEALDKEFVS